MPHAPAAELNAILTKAAFAPLSYRAFLRITGSDATRWLNGMVTNSIQSLQPGQGNYNFLLNSQGRIEGDCTIFRDPDSTTPEFFLQTSTTQVAHIQQHLDRFIIMDDVELLPIMDDQHALSLAGPQALSILMALGTSNYAATPCSPSAQAPSPQALTLKRSAYAGQPVSLIQAFSPLVPRFEIWSDPSTIVLISAELETTQAHLVSTAAFDSLRILEGTPLYGEDIRNTESRRDLAQETAQTHALHFAKGCYLGQEIVERIRSRGQVHRTFYGFQLSALPSTLPSPLTFDGKPAGELTSAAILPLSTGDTPFALGYIRREALESSRTRNHPLTFDSGTATPTHLPFHPPERQ